MYTTFTQTVRYIQLFSGMAFSLLTIQACSIKEDLDNCIDDRFFLYVKVADTETDIDASIHLFNHMDEYIRTYQVSATQIKRNEPLIIEDYDPMGMSFSAWNNGTERINISTPQTGNSPDKLTLSALSNPENPACDLTPDELFYGWKQTGKKQPGLHTEEITLTRKNARLHITVRGIQEKNNSYYFSIINAWNGYDFRGIPVSGTSSLEEEGVFKTHHDLVTPKPLLMFHTLLPEDPAKEENKVWVNFYRKTSGKNNPPTALSEEIEGLYISLFPNQTTNVLILISDEGCNGNENNDLLVRIEVTHWDEVFQWEEF